MKTAALLFSLTLLPSLAYSAECQRDDGQTAVARAAQLTAGKEAISAAQQAELLACLTLAAQIAEATIEGLREGEIPFKAIRYETISADPDK